MTALTGYFDSHWPWLVTTISAASVLISTAATLHVLLRRRDPMAMLAWVLVFLLLPLLGPLLYFLLGMPRVQRRTRRKQRRIAPIARALAEHSVSGSLGSPPRSGGPRLRPAWRELVDVFERLGEYPVTAGNRVRVLRDATAVYEDLIEHIRGARSHVHLEYYIFRADETGRSFLTALVEKAREGVEVRVLLDGIGCFGTRRSFFAPLARAGGRVETFLPAVPLRRKWNINYRNHRKIAVVDGRIAWTGSQNIGDEYRGPWRRVAPWKDTHLRVEGPAAEQLQRIFVEDWYFAAGQDLARVPYLRRQEERGSSLVQIVPSGPDQPENALKEILFLAISRAERRVRLCSPYFVPDRALLLGLKTAAHRGVDVEVLIPARSNHRFVLWAGRSYYQELLEAGVRIFEHPSVMLHSKVVTIDEQWALVGSANMDVRSFRLNFEASASIFDPEICRELDGEIDRECGNSREITLRETAERTLSERTLEGAARLCSPLL